MQRQEILGGRVQLYRRADGESWHCSASVGNKQRRSSTRSDSLALAKQVAEDWYLGLRGKLRAGVLKSEEARTAYWRRHTYVCLRLMEGADLYAVAGNCRTSVEMIQYH